jgi:hypothetical protein
MYIKLDNNTAIYIMIYIMIYKTYTLAGFEPEIVCYVDGLDDHYATPRRFLMLKIFR